MGVINSLGGITRVKYPFQVEIPAGAVDKETELFISPIASQTRLGNGSDSIQIGGFQLSPSTVTLKKPISISFTPNLAVKSTNKFFAYYFNGPKNPFNNTTKSNKLKLSDDQVSYDAKSNIVKVAVSQMTYVFLVADIKVSLSIGGVQKKAIIIQNGSVDNCNCGNITVKELKYPLNTVFNTSEELQIAERNEAFRVLNLPVNTNPYEYINTLTVDKCSSKAYQVTAIQEVISGNLGGIPWRVNVYRASSVSIATTTQRCPITTPCHQGCPQ